VVFLILGLLNSPILSTLNKIWFKSIGKLKEWGVLSFRLMSVTTRMTKDSRILIRNNLY